jgi:hypothetical protein
MSLIHVPARPRWHPLVRVSFASGQYPVWKNFLDVAYWNAELQED